VPAPTHQTAAPVWINKIVSGREAELAERMGVDRAYVSGLELGQRNPTIVTLWHLAALFLIVGVALAIEAASGGYGIGLVIVAVMADGPGLVFFILAALSAATAMHLRP
jgi:transcriptional regulator with XRE-family HTH domain